MRTRERELLLLMHCHHHQSERQTLLTAVSISPNNNNNNNNTPAMYISTALTQLSRSGVLLSQRNAQVGRSMFARALATKPPVVDHKFLDQIEEKASQMEDLMQDLGETHSTKQEPIQEMKQTVKWMDPEEMEFLFDLAARQKRELRDQLTEIQCSLAAAKTNFAVDAPDGESDGRMEEEMDAVQQILEEHVAHVEQEKKCTAQRTAPNEWMSG